MKYQLKFGSFQGAFNTLADVLVAMNLRHNEAISDIIPNANAVELTKVGSGALQVVRNSYGEFGVVQQGTAAQIIEHMIDEVDRLYVRPAGVVLQPWQMPSAQWRAVNAIGKAAYSVYPCFTDGQRSETCWFIEMDGKSRQCNIAEFCALHFYKRFGYGHNGPPYGPNRESNSRHDVQVAYALADGKPVPEDVIQEYRQKIQEKPQTHATGRDKWFDFLVENPAFRGKISASRLGDLLRVLRTTDITLTAENATSFIAMLSELGEAAGYIEMDDLLYQKGAIGKLKAIERRPVDIGEPVSALASKIRQRIIETKQKDHLKRTQEKREKLQLSLREVAQEHAIAEMIPADESYTWANKLATAVAEKNLEVLLGVLDTANDWNVASKKAVFEETGLKTLNVKAEARRSAIFTFCGYDDLKRKQYERDKEANANQRKTDREKASITSRVEQEKVNVGGGIIISAKEYVDQAIAEGFTEIAVRTKGCTKEYWLLNPVKSWMKSLMAKNGMLEYARLVHGLSEQKQAA